MSLYYSMTLFIYYYCAEKPYLEAVDGDIVWDMILLHFLAKIKERVVDGATFDILYNFWPKVIITEQGIDSYTT